MPGWVHCLLDLSQSAMWRPSLDEVEAAARVLHKVGSHHHWWKPYSKSYDEMAATDPIAKSEFDGIVEQMLMGANEARPSNQDTAEFNLGQLGSKYGQHPEVGDVV